MKDKKLRKNSGITIVHALVSVLIFAVFSSIVLSATATNIKSYNSQKDYQQAYLTVSNAAELFIDSIEDDYIEYKQIFELDSNTGLETERKGDKTDWKYVDSNLNNPLNTGDNGSVNNEFMNAVKNAINGTYSDKTYKINVNLDESSGQAAYSSEVTMELHFIENGSICADFYLTSALSNNNYYMSVTIPINSASLDTPYQSNISNIEKTVNGVKFKKSREDVYQLRFDTANIETTKGKYETSGS